MNFLHSKQNRAIIVLMVLGIVILIAIAPYASGLLGATVLYVMCVPVFHRLRKVMSADAAAAVTLVGAIVVIALPLTWIVFLVADQLPSIIGGAQGSSPFSKVATLKIGNIQVGAEIAKASGSVMQWISAQALSVMGTAASATLNIVISLFALYYMLISSNRSWDVFRRVLPFSEDTADELRARFYSVTHATLLGTAMVAVAQGALIGVGFALVGIPNAVFWGVVTGAASVLPVLGSALVWLPGVIVLLVQARYGAAAGLTFIGAVLASNVDNVIRPMVYSRVSNIHPMVTLVGAFAGVTYFGLLGILLGPLAIQYFLMLMRIYREEYIDKAVTRTMEMRIPHAMTDPTFRAIVRETKAAAVGQDEPKLK